VRIDQRSSKYSELKIYYRTKNKYYYDSIESYLRLSIPRGSKILELGCATGETLEALEPSRAIGLDFNPYLVAKAKEKFPGFEFNCVDVDSRKEFDEFASNCMKVDYIILSDLIGSLQDIQKVFERVRQLCHERTKVIVTYYNYFWNFPLRIAEKLSLKFPEGVKNWLYIDEIKNMLQLSGFEVIKSESILLLPLKIPLVSYVFNRFIARLPLIKRLCLVGLVTANFKKSKIVPDEFATSIIIPAKNEEGHIDEIIERIPSIGSHTEIIFVEGNSSDKTFEKIEEAISKNPGKDIKLLKQYGKGKADAVRMGFSKAGGDILMILDADITVPPEDLTKFYNAIASGNGEFINGTRLVYQMEGKAMRPLNKFGNIVFSKVFSYLLDQRITDTLCGTKVLFKSDFLKFINDRNYFGDFDPFGDFNLLFNAARFNLKIVEIPIRYGERIYGTTNINRFRDGILLLKMCVIAMRKIKFTKPV
jgi:SAM-dependent methyltransferase